MTGQQGRTAPAGRRSWHAAGCPGTLGDESWGCYPPVRCGWQGGGELARRSGAPVGHPLQQVGFAVPAVGP